MKFQKIMVPFLNEKTGKAAFETSVLLADRFKAHIDVIHMRQRITPNLPGNVYYPIAVNYIEDNIDTLRAVADDRAEAQLKLFERLAKLHAVGLVGEAEHREHQGATAAWTDTDATLPYGLSSRARVADLTIIAKSNRNAPAYEKDLTEELLFQSGRPVLLIDSEKPPTEFPETILIAWNGGKEAASAIASSLPLLYEAKLVIVMSVGELPWGSESAENVASYLRLHGVHATPMAARVNKGVDPEEEFVARAKKRKADLIVMGAYSHSRWREIILGGFTRHLLTSADIPLFLSH